MARATDRVPSLAITALVFSFLAGAAPADAQRVLFDARHGQTAGNADWIVDADSSEQEWLSFRCNNPRRHHSAQRFPTPPQETIGPDTPETVWDGGISAWAVDLVKDALKPERERDWTIEQYPWDAPEFTFGDPSNPQDLAHYDVLILCEPNVLFTEAEARAIREFVEEGGGLFLCADHETSDRNCSGGPPSDGGEVHDSPFILNRMMQTDVETRTTPPYFDPADPENDFGVFGIWFYENGVDDPGDQANRAFDWFSEGVNRNVVPSGPETPGDPILHGPFGDGTGGLGLFGSTQMAVSTHPERGNPSARAHVWRNDASREANAQGVFTEVTFASAQFGAGRVVAVGDSSPADDGTGEGGLHFGWDRASGGVANDVIFLNATEWIAGAGSAPQPDETAPVITAGPTVSAARPTSLTVSWSTGEPATEQAVTVEGLEPESEYRLTVEAEDSDGARGTATLSATTPAMPTSLDLSGWRLVNDNRQFEVTFPEGTVIPAGGFLVIGRAVDRAGFEAAWGPLDPDVAYLDSGDNLLVNATPRPYTLLDAAGEVVDGPTVTIAAGTSTARRDACGNAADRAAWSSRPHAEADPGRGAPPACGAGIVITEMSDADDFRNEFVELWFDAGGP